MPSPRSRLYIAVLLAIILSFGVLSPVIYGYVFKTSSDESNRNPASAMIGKKLPAFTVKDHEGNSYTQDSFAEGRYIFNIFGSWCAACVYDHQAWAFIADRVPGARMIGVAWSDKKEDTIEWLRQYGNPYQIVLDDHKGKLAVALGVKGAPETFLVEDGIIIDFISGIARKPDIIDSIIPFVSE